MKKRILAVVLALSMVFSFLPFGVFAADTDTTITFELGANGSASHSDGSSSTGYTDTIGDYTLSLKPTQQFYTGGRDAKGNSAIKLGSSKSVGGFTLTVPDDVTQVIFKVAGYKATAAKISVGDVSATISTLSNNGAYTDVVVSTAETKTLTFTTVSGGVRAMINSISFVIPASSGGETECEHDYTEEVTTEATCTTTGVKTFTCSLCGDTYEEEIDLAEHTMVDGKCSVCGFDLSNIVFELGADGTAAKETTAAATTYTETVGSYTLSITDASKMYPDCIDANGNGVIKFGASSSAGSCTFIVPNDVSKVIIAVAGRNTANANIVVNGVAQSITTTSNSGVYTDVEVDTSVNKTVTFTTASGGWRAYVNSITYVVSAASEGECAHNYVVETTTEATCTTDGLKTYTCSLCGDIQTETIPAIGHNYSSAEVVETSYIIYTCANCGETQRTDIVLTPITDILALSANTSEEFFVKGTITEVKNSTYGNLYIEDEEGNQLYIYGLYDLMGKTIYNKMETPPVAGDTIIVRAPLTMYGTTHEFVNAKLIHHEVAEVLEPIESTIEELAAMKEGSVAQEYIVEGMVSSVKNTTYGNLYISDGNGNELYIYGLFDAEGNRYDAMTDKPVVGDTIKVQAPVTMYNDTPQLANAKIITLTKHNYTEEKVDATCTEAGYIKYTCSDDGCSATYTVVIDAIGHNYSETVVAPTCTEAGYTAHTCANCGDYYETDATEATGHSYDSVKVAPTYEDTGYTKHTCSGCGDTMLTDPTSSLSGVVQNVTATTEGDKVTITWDALTAVDKYIAYIYSMDGTLVRCVQKVSNTAVVDGIEVGEYVTLVIAKTTDGWYDFLQADEVPFTVTESEPEVEVGPTASAGEMTPDYVTITWPAVEGAIKYTVKITGNGETVYRGTTTNSVKVYGLKSSTEYEISVNAKTVNGYSGYGEVSKLVTPTNDNATLSIGTLASESVTLTWNAVDGADKYFIKLVSEGTERYYTTTSTSITINGLTPEKSYTASINTRTNGKHYSGYGSSVSFTTPAPEGISISSQLKADGVHLSWVSGLPFDKVWVKETLADGTDIQHAALSDGADKYTVKVYEEGTREFYLIVRVQTASGKKYVTTDPFVVTVPAPKTVTVASEAELKAALAAAQVGEIVKITLTADITATLADDAAVLFSVPKETDVILDLNGHTINATLPDNTTAQNESVFIINQDATLAVQGNGTINTTAGTNGAGSYIFNNSGATLLLVDGNYNLALEEGKKGFIIAIADTNSTLGEATTTIIGGNYNTSDNIGNMFRNFANHKTESCSLIIEGGSFTSNYSSASYPKAVFWNQAPNTNAYGTGYINIVRGSFSGLEVENEHPAENVTIGKKAFIGVYGTAVNPTNAEELKAALANGGYIVLNGDIDLTPAEGAEITGNVISKNTVLDLNGHTLTYAAEYVSGMNGTQISAITVDNGATLVIGNGTVEANSDYALYAKNGNLVVESGSYSAITSAVQVNKATVNINGGTFEGDGTYLLNCIDSAYNNGEAKITVKGGEFVDFNPADNAAEIGGHTNFVADGYVVYQLGNKYIVAETLPELTDSEQLQALIDAADEGETVVIPFDAEIDTALVVNKDVVIDLNGKTISIADDFVCTNENQSIFTVFRGGKLTVEDSIGGGTLDASKLARVAIAVTAYGEPSSGEKATLIINGGKLIGGWYAVSGNGSRDNTYIEINDGELVSVGYDGIYQPQNGELVINGGSVTGVYSGIYMLSGSLTVTGGTITGNGDGAVVLINKNDGTDPSTYNGIENLSITGGTFITNDANYDAVYSNASSGEKKVGFITGGTFNTELDSEIIAAGYEIVVEGDFNKVVEAGLSKDAEGNYLVENVDDLVFLSESVNSGTSYKGETIKLTADIDLNGAEFTPIGNTNGTYEFEGTFDGQDNTISNYKVSSAFGTGLFGITNGATIKNLNVYNVTVESNHTAGSIVGYAKHTTVENCSAELVTVSVIPDMISEDPVEYDNGNHAGGVVAHAASSIVKGCSAKDVTILAYRDAGGVVGTVEGYDDAERYYGYVQDCTAENITITIDQLTYFYAVKAANAGGVVGRRAGDASAIIVENNAETNVNIETNVAVNTFAGLKSALDNGEKEINIAGPITLTSSLAATDVTFTGITDNAAINFAGYNIGGSGSITYKNLDLTTVSLPYADGANGERYGWYGGIDYNGHSVANYENCEITGVFTTYSDTVNATGCTFNYYVQDGEEYYGMFLYSAGTVNANDCTFMYGDRAIKIYSEGAVDIELNIDDCKFVATEDYKLNKALINIDSTYLNSVKLNIGTLEIDEKLSSLAIHNGEGNSKVTESDLVDSGDELQDAINNGSGNITLEGDIDLGDLGGIIIS